MTLLFIMSVLRQVLAIGDEEGASLIEYAMLLLFIVVVALVAIVFIGHITTNSINNSANTILQHTSSPH